MGFKATRLTQKYLHYIQQRTKHCRQISRETCFLFSTCCMPFQVLCNPRKGDIVFRRLGGHAASLRQPGRWLTVFTVTCPTCWQENMTRTETQASHSRHVYWCESRWGIAKRVEIISSYPLSETNSWVLCLFLMLSVFTATTNVIFLSKCCHISSHLWDQTHVSKFLRL